MLLFHAPLPGVCRVPSRSGAHSPSPSPSRPCTALCGAQVRALRGSCGHPGCEVRADLCFMQPPRGGVVEFPQVECSVMFGCQRPPLQSGLYCCDHHPSSSSAPAPADARRILRHRDDNGVRRYKVDASPHWFSSSELSIRAIQEYEGLLAEKKARRKRRRGQPLEDPNDNGPPRRCAVL